MNEEKDGETCRARPAAEWAVGAVSAILVACLVLYLGGQALFGETRPADLHASIEDATALDDATRVTVTVGNRGDEAAFAVTVLATGADAAVTRSIEFDYVAAHATRRGTLVFPGRLEADEIRVVIGGYTGP